MLFPAGFERKSLIVRARHPESGSRPGEETRHCIVVLIVKAIGRLNPKYNPRWRDMISKDDDDRPKNVTHDMITTSDSHLSVLVSAFLSY